MKDTFIPEEKSRMRMDNVPLRIFILDLKDELKRLGLPNILSNVRKPSWEREVRRVK